MKKVLLTGFIISFLTAAFSISGPVLLPDTAHAQQAADSVVLELDCPNGEYTAVPDSSGAFIFRNLQPGACRLKVVSAEKEGVKTAREHGTGMATGRRQHEPIRFRVAIDGDPSAAKTMNSDEWSRNPVKVTIGGGSGGGAGEKIGRGHELKGHVTLIK